MKAVFLGLNALGDTLCTTPAIHEFRKQNPDATVIYVTQAAPFCRVLDNNPDIDLLLYSERLYFHGLPEPEKTNDWLNTLPLDLREGGMLYRLDLKLVCNNHEVFQHHIAEAFARLVGVEIQSTRPLVYLSNSDRRAVDVFARRPYIVFSMHTVSNRDRQDGRGKQKDWPPECWAQLAERLAAQDRFDIFVIGAERDPMIALPHVRRLYGLPIRVVAALLERAACVVSVENGIGHLCAAVNAPLVHIYSNMMPPGWAKPAIDTQAQVLYGDPLDLTVDQVMEACEQFTGAAAAAAV